MARFSKFAKVSAGIAPKILVKNVAKLSVFTEVPSVFRESRRAQFFAVVFALRARLLRD
jgi:hypothetical protein